MISSITGMLLLLFAETPVLVLSPERKFVVVVVSVVGFLAIVIWAGRRLLRAMREQRNRGQPPPFW